MIIKNNNSFILNTEHTTYAFRVMETGQLEHLYYGRRITLDDTAAVEEKHAFSPGNTNCYDKEHPELSLEDVALEMSAYGKGDIREPLIEVVHGDGSYTSDFVYEAAELFKGINNGSDENPENETVSDGSKNEKCQRTEKLPHSYADANQADTLIITLKDKAYNLTLKLFYHVFEACDVITRNAVFINNSSECVHLKRLLSMLIDFPTADYVFTTFNGAWAREMKRNDIRVSAGRHVNESYTGSSSSRANPFVMLSKEYTTENMGECYGFNLIYSGNHYESAEASGYGKTRFVQGINPRSFDFVIEAGASFEAPEAVMTYSNNGFNNMSQHMHDFVREHIVRGSWKNKPRPILQNSWEAAYFDINESKLVKLAKAGREVGIELFVMDDGWFGERDDDTKSLGDWEANKKKLPNGLMGICNKIKKLGMDFGIWVEPEMVNVNSHLYKEHPEWVLQIPDKPHSEGRNQRILDLTKREVQDYIIEAMTRVFESADISYVKWDMNRTFTDYFSDSLDCTRQGEVAHRYILGLYRCMRVLTEKFPDILFEGCASGGNRFDLGILCYFPQIWASDNTDAICRAEIQTGYSYGYPMSVVSAHVSSCPNHQTLRETPIETRFNVASFGILGYECNFCDMKKEEMAIIKAQIELYKEWRSVLYSGRFYRGRSFGTASGGSVLSGNSGNITEWTCVSKDRKKAVGFIVQKLVRPNTQFEYYRATGLDENVKYHFYNRKLKYNVKEFGDLVNTVAPFHIKQDSLTHNLIAKFVKMPGETEEYDVYGDTLMYSGVKLRPSFGGTGYDERVRFFQDFSSRIYFMEEKE